jgi:hypothetical protein
MGGRIIPAAPSRLRRFDHAKGLRASVVLGSDHPAIREGRTLFPSTRHYVEETGRVLKSGHNSRKIGKVVTKGKWRGFPIYTLTLPERETCPASCAHWSTCYGNNMHLAERVIPDSDFEDVLWLELEALNRKHPAGYLVRLHVLGDFYSEDYVSLWRRALRAFPALHVFGYTARDGRADPIGRMLMVTATVHWDRFALRFSGRHQPHLGAVTIEKGAASPFITCPAQQGRTECCGTCALCWQSTRTIAFERH